MKVTGNSDPGVRRPVPQSSAEMNHQMEGRADRNGGGKYTALHTWAPGKKGIDIA